MPDRPLPAGGERVYLCHVVKTGGTTLRRWLADAWPPELVFAGRTWDELVMRPPDELRAARLVAGHFGGRFRRFFPEPVVSLTMLRDPIEHVLSRHGTLLASDDDPLHAFARDEAPTITALLSSEFGRWLATNRQTKELGLLDVAPSLARYWHAAGNAPPYADPPRPPEPFPSFDELYEEACRFVDECRWIGVVERFGESVELLAAALNIDPPGPLAAQNVGTRRVASEQLIDDEREALESLNTYDRALHDRAVAIVDDRWRSYVRQRRAEWLAACYRRRAERLQGSARLELLPEQQELPTERVELAVFAAPFASPAGSRVTVTANVGFDSRLRLAVNGDVVDSTVVATACRATISAVLPCAVGPWTEVSLQAGDAAPVLDRASLSARIEAP